MSSLKQSIRSVLADVETFLVETLKGVKLSGSGRDHKDRLLDKIRQLLEEIPGSAGSHYDSGSGSGSLKISGGGDSGSGGGTSSSNLQSLIDEESVNYSGNIPNVAISDLKNKLQTGMLDKKKKSGFKSWEPLYCVVNNNTFYMYKKQGDSKQKEAFCLNGYEFHEAPGLEKDASKKEMCFEVTKAGEPTYQFRAGSKEAMEIWKKAITKGIQIAAEEEPKGNYDLPYLTHTPDTYAKFGEQPIQTDEEIYVSFDDVPTYPAPAPPRPSAPLPPVPGGKRLSLPANVEVGGGYENLMEEQKKKTVADARGRKVSTGDIRPPPDPAVNHFKNDSTGDGQLFPSEIKKASSAAPAARLGGNKHSNPPPPSTGHYVNTPQLPSPQAPSSNPNKNRKLPSVPKEVGSAESGKNPASPDPPPSAVVKSDSRSSPPPQGPGVNSLMKMFEKK